MYTRITLRQLKQQSFVILKFLVPRALYINIKYMKAANIDSNQLVRLTEATKTKIFELQSSESCTVSE